MPAEQHNDRYLLVSDSNEMGNKYDSKRLREEELTDLAQDNLLKRSLDMSRYLTIQEFIQYKEELEKIPSEQPRFDTWTGKFRVVDGQVILLRSQDVDSEPNSSPLQYLRDHWDITPDYRVIQIQDCMLRGMTEIKSDHKEKTQLPTNTEVAVGNENMPPHMHHSGIDMAEGLQTMQGGDSQKVGFLNGEIRYDMFYNESFSTGVSKNEQDGVVDSFEVQDSGTQTTENTIYHNNMPVHDRFYVFAIQKIAV